MSFLALVTVAFGSILQVMLAVGFVGFIAWLIVTLIEMGPKFQKVVYAIAGFLVLVILLTWLGVPMPFSTH